MQRKDSVNICNAGIDADVANDLHLFRHLPLINGKTAYILGLIKNFFSRLGKYADIYLDGERIGRKNLLLFVAANGQYYGGS